MQCVVLLPTLSLSWPPHVHHVTQLPAPFLKTTQKDESCQLSSDASSSGQDGEVPAQKGNLFFLSCTVSTPGVLLSSNLIPLFSASFNAPNAAPANTAAPTTTFRIRPPLQGMPGCVSERHVKTGDSEGISRKEGLDDCTRQCQACMMLLWWSAAHLEGLACMLKPCNEAS